LTNQLLDINKTEKQQANQLYDWAIILHLCLVLVSVIFGLTARKLYYFISEDSLKPAATGQHSNMDFKA
jgi:hypothetical protein